MQQSVKTISKQPATPRARSARRGGFTLIELLVVVAIIALLISILLPALNRAREIAKITVCLANMRTLCQATYQYFNDQNDTFPSFTTFSESTGRVGFAPFSWGGKTPDPFWNQPSTIARIWYITADQRPMNPYIVGADVGPTDEVPAVRDPADKRLNSTLRDNLHSHGDITDADLLSGPGSAYDDVGTSYYVNPMPLFATNWDSCSGSNCMFAYQGNLEFGPWTRNMRALMQNTRASVLSELVFFTEDTHQYSLQSTLPYEGAHGQMNKFNAGFLDGHAEYREFDPKAWGGDNWTLINPDWLYDRSPRAARYYPADWVFHEDRNPDTLP